MSKVTEALKHAALFVPIALALAGALTPAQANPPAAAIGLWLSPEQGWVVETASCDSGLCGFLVSFRKGKSVTHVVRDSQNPDPTKRNTPLCGLKLLGGFTQSIQTSDRWEKGWVYDPETGSTYTGVAQVVDANTVNVRGYVVIPLFGRTLTLVRMVGAVDRCSVPAQAVSAVVPTVVAVAADLPQTGQRR